MSWQTDNEPALVVKPTSLKLLKTHPIWQICLIFRAARVQKAFNRTRADDIDTLSLFLLGVRLINKKLNVAISGVRARAYLDYPTNYTTPNPTTNATERIWTMMLSPLTFLLLYSHPCDRMGVPCEQGLKSNRWTCFCNCIRLAPGGNDRYHMCLMAEWALLLALFLLPELATW